MKTFNGIVPGKEAICLHLKLLIIYLHNERGTQVDDIGITNIWKLGIRKAFGILFP